MGLGFIGISHVHKTFLRNLNARPGANQMGHASEELP